MPNLRKMRTGRVRRVPRPLQPDAIRVAYFAELKKMLGDAKWLVKERLLSRLPELLDRAAEHRGDSFHEDAQPPGRRINSIMNRITAAFNRAYSQDRLEKLAEKFARRTSEHQKQQLFNQVKSGVGIDLKTIADRRLTARIKAFTSENVALIKSIPGQYFDDVEKRVLSGMRAGERHTEIADDLEERFEVSESRAKLIARDQVGKFNGELNRVRQQDLGVDTYIWRTVEDNRVRAEHVERDGNVYRWDDPPGDPGDPATGGHPGEAINCRCYAEPNLAAILDSEPE